MVKGTDRNGREVPAGGVIKDPALTEALEAIRRTQ